jgi:hypothetical protein
MDTITLNKKEYSELLKMKKLLEKILASKIERNKIEIPESSFGILRNSFGKKNSVFYVSEMRKSWREK